MAETSKLREKVGDLPAQLDPAIVERVEAEVAAFNSEVEAEFGDEIAHLQELTSDGSGVMSDPERRRALYRYVHRVWGDAPSRGHPLLGRAAESLRLLLENDEPSDDMQIAILEHHVAAMASI